MKRSFGIDILRSVSIMMVIFRHFGFYTHFNWGYFAVESLFIVSGYLIGQMLIHSYFATPQVQPEALTKFMFRRWMRVFPLYYFLLIVKFILTPAIGWHIIYYFLFLQNHFYGVSFFPVTWSLGIEEWFYIFTPIALYVFMRKVSSKVFNVFLFFLTIIITINLLRFFWVYYTNRPFDAITGCIPLRLDSPLIGVLLAFIKFGFKDVFKKLNTLPVFLFGLTAMALWIWLMHIIRSPVDRVNSLIWARTISYTTLGIITAICLPFLEQSVPIPPGKIMAQFARLIKWIGKVSFALYLTHGDVHYYTIKLLPKGTADWIIVSVALIATFGVSWLLHWGIEKRVLEWRDRKRPDNWQSKI
jgi:peptidoglycan/LPS O-acetylase OafA/YrhL